MNNNGATVWARKTIDSEIFYDKPDKWFKIWFFIVNKASHKPYRKYQRGQGFITFQEIIDKTKCTRDQADKCCRWLREQEMWATQKATRGMHFEVLNYDLYQNLDNYEARQEARQKRDRSDTKDKNDKNEKKYICTKKLSKTFNHDFEILKLTATELSKLAKKFADDLRHTLVDFENSIGAKNYKYKSHYRAILKWYDKPKTPEFYLKEMERLGFASFANKYTLEKAAQITRNI